LEPSMSRINFIQKETRRARILKLVKDNREVTIKDISNHFPGVSEKTVQREIVSLTESGILKKTGERRWSRYTLA
jgi:DeoR/GlpR family transcriptional regulator of sugar metabolism